MQTSTRSICWSQRIALTRHTLHGAVQSGDFTFFKTLQAHGMLHGVNYVATLTDALGDDGDALITALDDFNTSLAHTYEDAFKTVYTKWKALVCDAKADDMSEARSNIYVDASMQRQIADMAIDKTTNSVTALIEKQPRQVQDTAASVWIGGVAIIADAIQICVQHMGDLHSGKDDFIRMENSWSTVVNSVTASVSALRGIYNLMDATASDSNSDHSQSRRGSYSAIVFRRLSNAFASTSPNPSRSSSFVCKDGVAPGRAGSVSLEHRTGPSLRSSVSSACPSGLPDKAGWQHTALDPIPPTPATDEIDPFDNEVPSMPKLREGLFRDIVMT